MIKIAIAQLTTSTNKAENLTKAVHYIKQAKQHGADLVVLPETFMAFIPANSNLTYAEVAEDLQGNFVSTLAKTAKEQGIYVVCGIYEKKQNELSRAYNTIVMLNKQGELIHTYSKTHLYDAFAYSESDNIIASNNPFSIVETEIGKIGVLVCYELRFPEISRSLALQGADILLVPTAWVAGPMKEEHLLSLAKARALENTVFVCTADQVGNIYAGRSTIYNPMGVVLASRGEDEGLIMAEIDINQNQMIREKLPCLEQRRPALYSELI